MTYLSVRQYLDAHGIEASTDDCLHLSQAAKRYSAFHHIDISKAERLWGTKHTNLYDIRVLEAVCKNFRHSDTEHLCIWCLKLKPNKYFYLKTNGNLFSHCRYCHATGRAKQAGTMTKAAYLRQKARNHPKFAERMAKLYGEK